MIANHEMNLPELNLSIKKILIYYTRPSSNVYETGLIFPIPFPDTLSPKDYFLKKTFARNACAHSREIRKKIFVKKISVIFFLKNDVCKNNE